ncbi:MAG: hypothetical protein QOG67_1434 [Verrucomicrobiota bacterium]
MKGRGLPCYPTRSLAGLVFVLAAMWYAGSTQNSAAVYLLLFALASVFLVSIPHTLLNLAGLTVKVESVKPAFAGQEISLSVEVINDSRATRRGIVLGFSDGMEGSERTDQIPAGDGARLTLRFPAPKRGEHQVEKLRLTSSYPLGFLDARKNLVVSQRYVVYPAPAGDPTLPMQPVHFSQNRPQSELGEGDDFAGVRAYVAGESQRHIDWKAVARGQSFMTKQFTTDANSGSLSFDFAKVPSNDTEKKLSQLALWVIEAERAQRPYGLRLPDTMIPVSLGEQHFHRCLGVLALFR